MYTFSIVLFLSISKASSVISVFRRISTGVNNIRATIEGVGLNILDIVGCKKLKEKDVNPDKPSRAFVYVW